MYGSRSIQTFGMQDAAVAMSGWRSGGAGRLPYDEERQRTMKTRHSALLAEKAIKSHLNRRQLLRGGAAGLGLAGLHVASPGASLFSPLSAAAQDETHLAFIAGSYESGLVRENLDRFESQYPGLKVDFTPENDGTYLQKMTVVLSTGGSPVDVMYVGDEQLGTWAEAGWLMSIDDFPETEQYKKDLFPFKATRGSCTGSRTIPISRSLPTTRR
jgi:hypothetical protein